VIESRQTSILLTCNDIAFAYERDARRVLSVLPKRLAKYDLVLHPEKTRLIDFRRPGRRVSESPDNNNGDARSRPDTFGLLGFTHYWARSRKGFWVVKQKTAADRFRRTLKHIADWCRQYRHEPVREQWMALRRKLLRHFGYFGISGNSKALCNLRHPRLYRRAFTPGSQTHSGYYRPSLASSPHRHPHG
jgi:RNA-directed DNA polymerase